MTVSELGEHRLLARIRERLGAGAAGAMTAPGPHAALHSAAVVIGIGDDAAVVAPARNTLTVLTTDAQVEGVHFDWRFSRPADVGWRALAVNLSDLAAMGAVPRWGLLSLALPGGLAVADVEDLVAGLAALAAGSGMAVVGGNLTQSPGPLVIDVTAVGEVQPRRVLTRAGGRPGDELYVSGTIGAAAAGLEMLRERVMDDSACVARYRRPEARVRLGVALGRARAARAAMDLSDGLADAVHQVAAASGCGVEIDANALPIDPAAQTWWRDRGVDPVAAALRGGDDYELLFAIPRAWRGRLRHARSRVADPPLTRIGVLTKHAGEHVLIRDGRREALPSGFEHWS